MDQMDQTPAEERERGGRLARPIAAALTVSALVNAALLAASLIVPTSRAARFYEENPLEQGAGLLRRLGLLAGAWLVASLAGLAFRNRLAGVLRRVWADRAGLADWARSTFTRGDVLVCVGLVALALALRLPWLGQAVRFDETTSYVYFAARGPAKTWATYGTNNHVLHNMLMSVTTRLLGAGPWGLRLPTLAAGSLLAALLYLAGRSLVREGEREGAGRPRAVSLAGLLAGGLAATLAYFVYFSVNARGYAMLLCFLALCLIVAPPLRRGNAAAGLLFAVGAALGMATIPIMAYPLAGVGAWLLLSTWRSQDGPAGDRRAALRTGLCSAAAAVTLTLAFYTPAMISGGLSVWFSNKMTQPLPRGEFLAEMLPWAAGLWRSWAVSPAWLAWPLLVLTVAGVIAGRRRLRPSLLLVASAAWLGLLLWQSLYPFPRVMMPLLAMILLAAGAGAARLAELVPRGRVVAAGLILAMMTLAGVASTRGAADLDETGVVRDADRLAADLRELVRPGEAALASYIASRPMFFYFHRDGPPDGEWFIDPPPDPAVLRGRVLWLALDEAATLPTTLVYLGLEPASADGWQVVRRYPHGGRLLRRVP